MKSDVVKGDRSDRMKGDTHPHDMLTTMIMHNAVVATFCACTVLESHNELQDPGSSAFTKSDPMYPANCPIVIVYYTSSWSGQNTFITVNFGTANYQRRN